MPTLDDLSRVWALAENSDAPTYYVHVSRAGMTAAEVRETVAQLVAVVDRIESQARSETLIRKGLAPMLRELNAVRGPPDDDPRRQAALETSSG